MKNIGMTFAPLLVATLLAGVVAGAAGTVGTVGVAAAEEAAPSSGVTSQVGVSVQGGACGRIPEGCYLSARALLRGLCARRASANAAPADATASLGAGLGSGAGAGFVDEDADGVCDNYEDGLCGTGLGAGFGAGQGQGLGQGWGAGQGRGCGYGARR